MKFPEQNRWKNPTAAHASRQGDRFGVFVLEHGADRLVCIATDGSGLDAVVDVAVWEHVSVTVRNRRGVPLQRCPSWEQMSRVKAFFWDACEAVVQFHPPESEYVNQHPFCLHLWRLVGAEIPRPPAIYVGEKTSGSIESAKQTATHEAAMEA